MAGMESQITIDVHKKRDIMITHNVSSNLLLCIPINAHMLLHPVLPAMDSEHSYI